MCNHKLSKDSRNSGNPFLGQSKGQLQSALLSRLAAIADLRSESRRYRDRLTSVRSELQQAQYEIELIQFSLEQEKVVAFPTPAVAPVEEPARGERILGRWGQVSYQSPEPAKPKSQRPPTKIRSLSR